MKNTSYVTEQIHAYIVPSGDAHQVKNTYIVPSGDAHQVKNTCIILLGTLVR
jgi:hypothetical protein